MKSPLLTPAIATIILLSIAAAGIVIGGIALIVTTLQYNGAQDTANRLDAAASSPKAEDGAWRKYYIAADEAATIHRRQDVAAAAVDAGFFAGLGYLGISALGISALGRRRDERGDAARGSVPASSMPADSMQAGHVQGAYQPGPVQPPGPYYGNPQQTGQYQGQFPPPQGNWHPQDQSQQPQQARQGQGHRPQQQPGRQSPQPGQAPGQQAPGQYPPSQ